MTNVATNVIGIDVGGTTVKGARVSADGAVLESVVVPTPVTSRELTAAVIAVASGLRDDRTAAVGVASAGIVQGGVVRYATNLPWRDEPVRERIAAALDVPVVLTHDTAAAAVAECAQLSDTDVLYVGIGTGIACAHVRDGVVHTGATGRAGEIGHSPVRPGGDRCACGQRGCLEAYASAAAITRRYTARTGRALDARQIAEVAHTDPDAGAVWADAVDALATALATDTMVSDPGAIIIGGGLAEAGETLLAPLRAALDGLVSWRPVPPLRAASLGAAAGPLGAAHVARRILVPEECAR
jgi:glucokinase